MQWISYSSKLNSLSNTDQPKLLILLQYGLISTPSCPAPSTLPSIILLFILESTLLMQLLTLLPSTFSITTVIRAVSAICQVFSIKLFVQRPLSYLSFVSRIFTTPTFILFLPSLSISHDITSPNYSCNMWPCSIHLLWLTSKNLIVRISLRTHSVQDTDKKYGAQSRLEPDVPFRLTLARDLRSDRLTHEIAQRCKYYV